MEEKMQGKALNNEKLSEISGGVFWEDEDGDRHAIACPKCGQAGSFSQSGGSAHCYNCGYDSND